MDTEFITIFCVTACRPWYIYYTKIHITVQSVVSMSISLVALNEHKLINALICTINKKIRKKSCNCKLAMTTGQLQLHSWQLQLQVIGLKNYQLQLHQLTVINYNWITITIVTDSYLMLSFVVFSYCTNLAYASSFAPLHFFIVAHTFWVLLHNLSVACWWLCVSSDLSVFWCRYEVAR